MCELSDNPEGADYWYTGARGYALLCDDPDILGEVAYFSALSAWSRRDLGETAAQLAIVSQSPSPRLRAISREVAGVVAIANANYSEALACFETGLILLGACEESSDHWIEASFLRHISSLAADLGRNALTELIAARYDAFKWSGDQQTTQFACAFNIGLALDAMGFQVRAFKYFRDAAELAPDMPFQMLVYAVRSRAAQITGEKLFADDQLSSAMRIYNQCDWSVVNAEGRLALLELAIALSNTDPAEASNVIARYRSVTPIRSADLVNASDPRLLARETYAEGLVLLAMRDNEAASQMLHQAFDLFDSLEQVQCASECSVELGRLGVRDRKVYAAIERASIIYENSWIGRRARSFLQSEMVVLST